MRQQFGLLSAPKKNAILLSIHAVFAVPGVCFVGVDSYVLKPRPAFSAAAAKRWHITKQHALHKTQTFERPQSSIIMNRVSMRSVSAGSVVRMPLRPVFTANSLVCRAQQPGVRCIASEGAQVTGLHRLHIPVQSLSGQGLLGSCSPDAHRHNSTASHDISSPAQHSDTQSCPCGHESMCAAVEQHMTVLHETCVNAIGHSPQAGLPGQACARPGAWGGVLADAVLAQAKSRTHNTLWPVSQAAALPANQGPIAVMTPPSHPSPLLHAQRWLGAWRGGGRRTNRWKRLAAGLQRVGLDAVLVAADSELVAATPGGELSPLDLPAGLAAAWLAEALKQHRSLPRGPTARVAFASAHDALTAPLALSAWLATAESQGAVLLPEPTKRRKRNTGDKPVPCTMRFAACPRVSQRLTFASMVAAHTLRCPAAVQQLYAFAHRAARAAATEARRCANTEHTTNIKDMRGVAGSAVPHEWGGVPVHSGAPPPLHPALYEVALRSAVWSGDVDWAQGVLADMRKAHVPVSEHAQVQVLALLRVSARRDVQGGGSDSVRRGERIVSSALAANSAATKSPVATEEGCAEARGGEHHLHTALASLQLAAGLASDAVNTLESRFKKRQRMTRSEYAALLSVHASQSDLHAAQAVLATMRGEGLTPGVLEFTTAMKAALPSNPRAALEMVDVFLAEGGVPDNAMYTQAMTAAHFAGDADSARQLHLLLAGPALVPSPLEGVWMERGGYNNPMPPLRPAHCSPEVISAHGLLLNERLYASLLGVCQRAQQPDMVTDVLVDAVARGIVPGVMCSAMLVGGHPRRTHENSKYSEHYEAHGWHIHAWIRSLCASGVMTTSDANTLQNRVHSSRGCAPGFVGRLLACRASRGGTGGSSAAAHEMFDSFFGVRTRFNEPAVAAALAKTLWSSNAGGLRQTGPAAAAAQGVTVGESLTIQTIMGGSVE